MGNLFFRDVKYLFEIFLTVWMFGTSVLFPVSLVGGKLGDGDAAQPDDADHRRLSRGAVPRDTRRSPHRSRWRWSSPSCIFGRSWLTFHRAEFQFAENI